MQTLKCSIFHYYLAISISYLDNFTTEYVSKHQKLKFELHLKSSLQKIFYINFINVNSNSRRHLTLTFVWFLVACWEAEYVILVKTENWSKSSIKTTEYLKVLVLQASPCNGLDIYLLSNNYKEKSPMFTVENNCDKQPWVQLILNKQMNNDSK